LLKSKNRFVLFKRRKNSPLYSIEKMLGLVQEGKLSTALRRENREKTLD